VTIQRQNTNNGNNQCSTKGNRENSGKKCLATGLIFSEFHSSFYLVMFIIFLSFLLLQQLTLIKFAYTSYLSFYKFLEAINAEFTSDTSKKLKSYGYEILKISHPAPFH